MTRFLLIAVGVYFAMTWIAGGPDDRAVLIAFGANYGSLVILGDYWRLVTSMFMHGNVLHLVVNGYALYLLGGNLEAFYGPWRFLTLFLVSGIVGSLASAMLSDPVVPSVGASGGIFGLLGGSVVFAFKYRRVLPKHVTRVMGTALLPWVGVNVALGILVSWIDSYAHLGGLAAGAITALFLTPASLQEALGHAPHAPPRYFASFCVALLIVSFLAAGENIFRLRGEDGPILDVRAIAVLASVDPGQVLPIVDREVERNPAAIDWRELRAGIRIMHGDWAGAEADYRRILEAEPDETGVLNNLAWLLLEQAPSARRNRAEAGQFARRAVELAPDDPFVLGTYGTARLRAGDAEEAVTYLRKAISLDRPGQRGEATDRYLLAIALARMGNALEADESLEAAVRSDPENDYRSEAEAAVRGAVIQSDPTL